MNRNVLCTSNPIESELHRQAYEYAKKISEHLLPRTRGYLDMWVDGKKVQSSDDFLQEGEPILGKTYLPRKFKTAVVIPPLNDVDCYGNDLDFVAVSDGNGQLAGFNVLAGGGLSTEHGNGNTKTYPNISLELGFVPPEHALKAAEAVVTTQRNFGNRSHRKNDRTRYTGLGQLPHGSRTPYGYAVQTHTAVQVYRARRPHRPGERHRRQLAFDPFHRKRAFG